MSQYDYLKNLPIDTIKEVLYKIPASDIISLCIADMYIQNICADANFWESYTIKTNYLPSWTVNMWNHVLDDHALTWKEIARLYELEKISGYKLNFKELIRWYEKVIAADITWEELYQLFKFGKPIPVEKKDKYKYITIHPDMLLKDVLKNIAETFNFSITTCTNFLLRFNRHPMKADDQCYVNYDVNNDNLKVYNTITWSKYEDVPIGENNIFQLLSEIIICH
jgi:hypothetical protein